ncbi:hypothetical protein D3C75_650860 [compost metagenome]
MDGDGFIILHQPGRLLPDRQREVRLQQACALGASALQKGGVGNHFLLQQQPVVVGQRFSVHQCVVDTFDSIGHEIGHLRLQHTVEEAQNGPQLLLGLHGGLGEHHRRDVSRQSPDACPPGALNPVLHVKHGRRVLGVELLLEGLHILHGADVHARLAGNQQVDLIVFAHDGEIPVNQLTPVQLPEKVHRIPVARKQKFRLQPFVCEPPIVGGAEVGGYGFEGPENQVAAVRQADGVRQAVAVRVLLCEGLQHPVQILHRGGGGKTQPVRPILAVDDPLPGGGDLRIDGIDLAVHGGILQDFRPQPA